MNKIYPEQDFFPYTVKKVLWTVMEGIVIKFYIFVNMY